MLVVFEASFYFEDYFYLDYVFAGVDDTVIVPYIAEIYSKLSSDFFNELTGGLVGKGNANIFVNPIALTSKTTLSNGSLHISGSGYSSIIFA